MMLPCCLLLLVLLLLANVLSERDQLVFAIVLLVAVVAVAGLKDRFDGVGL
jgi:hypothetical protein